MIETNRAELWAVSVAIDGFATFGVLACPVRDFLDAFLVRFEESLVRRSCRYAGVLMVHRGSQDSRKWPFQARSRRAFSRKWPFVVVASARPTREWDRDQPVAIALEKALLEGYY